MVAKLPGTVYVPLIGTGAALVYVKWILESDAGILAAVVPPNKFCCVPLNVAVLAVCCVNNIVVANGEVPVKVVELNPQEYVNQDVKTNIIGKKRPINKAQMRTNVEDFMYKRKNDKRQVQKYFHVSHVRYAA